MTMITATDLTPGNPIHEAAALVALIRARVVTPHQLSPMAEELGSAVQLALLSEEDRLFARPSPTHAVIGAVTADDIALAVGEVEAWVEEGVDFRTVLDASYPAHLRTVFNHPPLLFVQGDWINEVDSQSVAVVGTRSASPEGLARARRLSRELVEAGLTVLSGLAAGVDAAAHQAALLANGRTAAVMGTGIRKRYPAENTQLSADILEAGGALLSQFFPEQPPTKWTFPQRNIVMSGLSMATVVVEASATSGARMQARVALQHGRTVYLLRSLVESHDWARKYVEEGAYGTAAIPISSTSEILERLSPPALEQVALGV